MWVAGLSFQKSPLVGRGRVGMWMRGTAVWDRLAVSASDITQRKAGWTGPGPSLLRLLTPLLVFVGAASRSGRSKGEWREVCWDFSASPQVNREAQATAQGPSTALEAGGARAPRSKLQTLSASRTDLEGFTHSLGEGPAVGCALPRTPQSSQRGDLLACCLSLLFSMEWEAGRLETTFSMEPVLNA